MQQSARMQFSEAQAVLVFFAEKPAGQLKWLLLQLGLADK